MSTSTNAYCVIADVKAILPPSYNLTTLPDATITTDVADASRQIDADLQDKCWPFNAIAGTPVTPAAVEQLCIWKAAIRCYHRLGIAGRVNPTAIVEQLDKWYQKGIEDIRTDKTVIPTETTSTEAITWGVEPLADDEYEFACTPKYVIPGSVVIAGMIYGTDYVVQYKEKYRGPILVKLGDFVNEAGNTVATITSYDWSYYRNLEIQARPVIEGSVRIVRA